MIHCIGSVQHTGTWFTISVVEQLLKTFYKTSGTKIFISLIW